ncbi:hypothetical protein JRO89_XS09G0102000 [Xanthoceras sorbifolium]|uniref:Formamidopyrimidine-DNA glycosylase catalytic domain-containing protein n=1 Tax=Xanthoceras sorbifolium TaxID=99658 RepID=A0ABQ8HL73_9ROSI|nr:hypothetical protein JRO89_XS09G0102000 [Xanthoceras sorbifolium]
MPELPEVEAARRAIEEHCLGKKIVKSIIADDAKVIDGVSASDFEASLLGKTVLSAHRKGKNLWLRLDSPPFPSFQFGMAGAIYIKGVAVTKYKRSAVNDTDEWPSKYSKFFVEAVPRRRALELSDGLGAYGEGCVAAEEEGGVALNRILHVQLDDGLELSFTDKRRFAKVRLLNNPASVPPISELGPDALLEPMTVDEFTESLSKRKIAIKALLLDQVKIFMLIPPTSYISGIGNWIADEVLYQVTYVKWWTSMIIFISFRLEFIPCKQQPVCPKKAVQICSNASRRLFKMQLKLMLTAAAFLLNGCFISGGAKGLEKLMVIEKAVEVGADSSQFPKNWIFHSREKKPGKAFVDGKKIDFITAGGRTTAYVPELQKLNGVQAAKAVGKPKKQTSKQKDSRDDDEEDNGIDEPESDGEENPDNVKTKKGRKSGGRGKTPSKRRKSQGTDEEDGDHDEDDEDDDDEVPKTRSGKLTRNKQAKAVKTSKEKGIGQKRAVFYDDSRKAYFSLVKGSVQLGIVQMQ